MTEDFATEMMREWSERNADRWIRNLLRILVRCLRFDPETYIVMSSAYEMSLIDFEGRGRSAM